MTQTPTYPLTERRRLIRTGQAIVTLRNPDGEHLVFRLRKRDEWTGADGRVRPGYGFWIDVREDAFSWQPVGVASERGTLTPTRHSTPSRAIKYGAMIALRALADRQTVVEERGRHYTVHTELRCTRCGGELTTHESLQRGFGPTCWTNHLKDTSAPADS